MFKKICLILFVSLLAFLSGCIPPATSTPCPEYTGYGRYTLEVGCGSVTIDGQTYDVTQRDDELVIDGHTIARGIYRKTRPWLYVHHIDGNSVDVTFDEGSKGEYPLYTGSSASIFDVYTQPWEMEQSTNAAFADNYWLISHRWSNEGIFFDLQLQGGDETSWELVKEDIFVSGDNTSVTIPEINTTVKINSFRADEKKAEVQFTTP